MQIDNYAKQLELDLKVEGGLEPDEEGGYQLTLAPAMTVGITTLEEGYCFRTGVGKVPEKGANEELYLMMMLGNLMGQGTGGAILSLDESGFDVQLVRELPFQMAYSEFEGHLEEFFNIAEYWKKKVAAA